MKRLLPLAFASTFLASSGAVIAQEASPESVNTAVSKEVSTEAQCNSIKTEFAAMQDQIPVQIDFMTSINGMSAMMGSESCLVSFSYSFKEDVMVSEVVKGSKGELTEDQALAFLQSDKGRNVLKTILKQQAEAIFEDLGANNSGIRYTMSYQSDGTNLKPIVFSF